MITPMNLSQILPIHMSVDLGRRDVDVTKHLLDRAQVGTPFQQVGGEGMPEGMRGDVLGDADKVSSGGEETLLHYHFADGTTPHGKAVHAKAVRTAAVVPSSRFDVILVSEHPGRPLRAGHRSV